jgi:hypothetical protein
MQQHANLRDRMIPVCCVTVIATLYVVGFVSRTELRHVVQTLPLWVGAMLGYLGARMAAVGSAAAVSDLADSDELDLAVPFGLGQRDSRTLFAD